MTARRQSQLRKKNTKIIMTSATRTYESQVKSDPNMEARTNIQMSMMDLRIAEARAARKAVA